MSDFEIKGSHLELFSFKDGAFYLIFIVIENHADEFCQVVGNLQVLYIFEILIIWRLSYAKN